MLFIYFQFFGQYNNYNKAPFLVALQRCKDQEKLNKIQLLFFKNVTEYFVRRTSLHGCFESVLYAFKYKDSIILV